MSNLAGLYDLIHSLTAAEKRNFRRGTSAYAGSQVLVLFDLLNREERFVKEPIRRAITEAGFMSNLPTLMDRLRKLLLNSLRSLHSHNSVDSRLLYLLEEVQILYRRNLPDQALKKIAKARKLALRFSRIPLALELNYIHRQILLDRNMGGQAYEEIRTEESHLLDLARMQTELDDLHIRARGVAKSDNAGDTEMIQPFLDHPQVKKGARSNDFLCRVFAWFTIGVSRYALQEYSLARAAFAEVMQCWYQQPEWINERSRLFLNSVTNYQVCLLNTQSEGFEELDQLHNRFSDHRFREPDVQLQFERASFQTRLVLNLNQGRFVEGEALARQVIRWLEEKSGALAVSTELVLRYNLFSFFFLQERYSDANAMARAIRQMPMTEDRKDIREFIRMVEPVLQFELGNVELLENLERSLRRYFAKRHRLAPVIPVMLEYYRRRDFGEREAMQELFARLQEVTSASERYHVGDQELLLWAEARATHHSLKKLFLDLIQGT